ncbi:MAG: hypothetical protein SFT94_07930 [Pseudanabaenaceae cyanobacterium bins.68]|nr:hypothetical protein [Pseudanabaenaceae cyanobacterium bins.68]
MALIRVLLSTPFLSTLFLSTALLGSPAIAQSKTSWKLLGQPVIELQYGEPELSQKVSQLNRRFQEIASRLNPNQTWQIDLAPLPKPAPLKKGEKPTPALPPRQVTIRLQGSNLLDVAETDALVHQAESVPQLADIWMRSLSNFLANPANRQAITATINLPDQIIYEGITYQINPEVALDRGLFRLSGKQFQGKAIFIQLPADQKSFEVAELTKPSKVLPKTLYLLNPRFQFIPYSK